MKRRFVMGASVLALVLSVVGPASAVQSDAADQKSVERGDFNSYVVIMQAEPLLITNGDNLDSRAARNRGQQLKASHDKVMRDAGLSTDKVVNDYVTALNGFSALINHKQAQKLAADDRVAMVLPDELLQPMTDSSGDFLGLSGPGSAYQTGVTGKGVVVGIIDTGIWPEHPSFADNGLPAPPPDPTPASPLPCEFGNSGTANLAGSNPPVPHHNPNDAAFTCQNKLIGARQMLNTYRSVLGAEADEFDSARDDSGHGTHTASTSAGNAGVSASILGSPVGDGTISGIAPDAHVIAYKGLGNQGGFTSDLASAINTAVQDGVHVINYSIGGGGGSLGADDIAFLNASAPSGGAGGVFVAASAGNNGPGPQTVGSPGDNPWLTGVAASTQSRFLAGTVELGNGATYEGASVTDGAGPAPLVDGATLGNEFCESSKPFSADISGKIVLCKRGVNARVDKSLAVKNNNGVGVIHFEASDEGNLFTDTHFLPTVHIDFTPGTQIKSYIASAGASATAEIRDTRAISTWPIAPSITQFSSQGPGNFGGDVIKPDITAPGIQILAGGSPFPDAGSVTGELFQAIAGTSMSSPHVAGLYALLKQAQPTWSSSAAKSALMTTAHQNVLDNDRVNPADPFDMGAGHANPGRVTAKGSAFQPGLVYPATRSEYLAWVCGASPANIGAATCATLAAAGFSLDPSDLNMASIGVAKLTGSQTVSRRVTNVSDSTRTYTATADAPAGYSVSVTPSSFKIAPGATVALQVTITNENAPFEEWRFGSMTLKEKTGQYSVRSPIAVKASVLDFPAEITGSGAAGSSSFNIKFGYSGDYDAASIGLVPATPDSRVVVQDPDQAFNRADGFSNDHAIPLTGAQVLRVALPASSTETNADLDIYLYNPSGQQVASSTAGSGSTEMITIDNPVDGTWHLWVHGWQTVGPDSPYTLYVFDLPAAPEDAGNLQITGEPANATNGATATINLSWADATAGQWWLGAVKHKRDSTVLGRTLVNINNLP